MIANVIIEIKAKQVDKTFSYLVPEKLKDQISIGHRVLVPFNNRKLEGFVLDINHKKTVYELKEILELVDTNPVLNKELIEIGRYISKKTLSTKISAYQTMLPTALKAKSKTVIPKKYNSYIELVDYDYIAHNTSQKQIIDILKSSEKVLKQELTNISISSLNTLLKKNIVKLIKKEAYRINQDILICEEKKELTSSQQKVISEISFDKFHPYLLFGVTGSGKTEVYMNLIDKVLAKEKTAIVLVPEISLTPQIINLFKKRFGDLIAILHSGLSSGEKFDEWRKIERQEVSIVIGARSAIFAPLSNIGIIIIDEEHSQSYKQENNPKYHAIDIALYRGKNHNCPVVMGSATPTVESYTKALSNKYKLLVLDKRINEMIPKTNLIDMKSEIRKGNKLISEMLKSEIENRLQKKEQVIILLNRRGYSTILSCQSCGYVSKCPKCDIPLTYHKTSNNLRCHYCGYGIKKIEICPNCKKDDIKESGTGTQKLEEEITNLFKSAKIVRMDIDTTSNKGAHEKITEAFRNQEYDILVGTQMIAKGLDFPNVTLVGVLQADASLNIPDFRSGEKTFALLNQVAGRSGRGKKEGMVIFQGFNLDHYSIVDAANNDYKSFYASEIDIRRKLKYPPFYNICLIRIMSSDYKTVSLESNKIANYLKNRIKNNSIILGPSVATRPRVNNVYYFQIMIKYKKIEDIYNNLLELKEMYNSNKVNIDFDLNPINL